MKILYLIILISLFCGCETIGWNMTRQEVIAACKECTEAGMKPIILRNGWDYGIRDVICVIPE